MSVVADTGGQARHPGATEKIMRYWAFGEGAAKIGWKTEGDHSRCVQLIQEAIVNDGRPPLPDHEIHGLCTNLEQLATGSANDGPGDRGHRGRG